MSCPGFGADNGVRTRDTKLGKLVLYQLSYVRSGSIMTINKIAPLVKKRGCRRSQMICHLVMQQRERSRKIVRKKSAPRRWLAALLPTLVCVHRCRRCPQAGRPAIHKYAGRFDRGQMRYLWALTVKRGCAWPGTPSPRTGQGPHPCKRWLLLGRCQLRRWPRPPEQKACPQGRRYR
jgi:hypothetical protein